MFRIDRCKRDSTQRNIADASTGISASSVFLEMHSSLNYCLDWIDPTAKWYDSMNWNIRKHDFVCFFNTTRNQVKTSLERCQFVIWRELGSEWKAIERMKYVHALCFMDDDRKCENNVTKRYTRWNAIEWTPLRVFLCINGFTFSVVVFIIEGSHLTLLEVNIPISILFSSIRLGRHAQTVCCYYFPSRNKQRESSSMLFSFLFSSTAETANSRSVTWRMASKLRLVWREASIEQKHADVFHEIVLLIRWNFTIENGREKNRRKDTSFQYWPRWSIKAADKWSRRSGIFQAGTFHGIVSFLDYLELCEWLSIRIPIVRPSS